MLRRPYSTLYLDTLMNLVALLLLVINIPAQDANAKPRAEYTLTMEWTRSKHRIDMDIYVMLPNGNICWFGNKDHGLVFIDRDHLGQPWDSPIRREDVQWLLPVRPGSYYVSMNNYIGAPEGEVALVMYDSKGKPLWSKMFSTPEQGREVIVAEFQFDTSGKWLGSFESSTSVKQLSKRPGG